MNSVNEQIPFQWTTWPGPHTNPFPREPSPPPPTPDVSGDCEFINVFIVFAQTKQQNTRENTCCCTRRGHNYVFYSQIILYHYYYYYYYPYCHVWPFCCYTLTIFGPHIDQYFVRVYGTRGGDISRCRESHACFFVFLLYNKHIIPEEEDVE